MMRSIRSLVVAASTALALVPGASFAAGGAGVVTNYEFSWQGLFGTYDQDQLQRGLQVYTEVCSACHGLQYVPIRTLSDPGGPHLPEEQVRAYIEENFIELYDESIQDWRMATPNDNFPGSNLENAPDLSLMAKARTGFSGPYGLGISPFFNGLGGPEYIASLLTHYTGNDIEQAGVFLYENETYAGGYLAMAQPLYDEQVIYQDGSPNDLDSMAQDVAAFLMWTAEPQMMARKRMGLIAITMLGLMTVLLYLTNKRLWAPIKAAAKRKANTPAE